MSIFLITKSCPLTIPFLQRSSISWWRNADWVSDKFPCQIITSLENLEIICIKLMLSSPITLCVTYVPPSPTAVYYDSLFNFLLHLHHVSGKTIILSDFKFSDIDWDTLLGNSPVSNQFKILWVLRLAYVNS